MPDSTEGDSIQGTAKDFKEERLGTLFSKRHGCNGRSLLFSFFFQVRISIPRRRKLRHWVYVDVSMIQVPANGRGSTNKSAQVGHRQPQWVVMYGVADDVGRVDHYTRF